VEEIDAALAARVDEMVGEAAARLDDDAGDPAEAVEAVETVDDAVSAAAAEGIEAADAEETTAVEIAPEAAEPETASAQPDGEERKPSAAEVETAAGPAPAPPKRAAPTRQSASDEEDDVTAAAGAPEELETVGAAHQAGDVRRGVPDLLLSITRPVGRAAAAIFVGISLPMRFVPESKRHIIDWAALTLAFWVPIVWWMALFNHH
jgi:hypothetical protein